MRLEDAAKSLVGDGHLLVVTDFDGTIAPFSSDPDDVAPRPKAVAALDRLARQADTTVAVLSGRAREDLLSRVGTSPDVLVIGEHGRDSGGSGDITGDDLSEIEGVVRDAQAMAPDSFMEVKRQSVAFHFRRSDPESALVAVAHIRDRLDGHEGLEMMTGKMVLEISVSSRNKGDAVSELAVEVGARHTVFIGDDATDEHVFEVLGESDIGVKVGSGDTKAGYRLGSIDEVADFLEWLAKANDLAR